MENRHFISNTFLAFYTEIARIKTMLDSPNPELLLPEKLRTKTEGTEDSGVVNYNQLAAYLSRRLESWLLQQRKKLEEVCTALELKTWAEGEYVMVALADELFILEIAWEGSEHWHKYLLETRLYNSDTSGTQFFTRLDKLLLDKSQDLLLKDLASVYLLAIRMGFAGVHRGRNRFQELDVYQRALLTFIGQGTCELPLLKQPYRHTVNELAALRLAPLTPWKKGIVLTLLIYILISYWVWSTSVGTLAEITRETASIAPLEETGSVAVFDSSGADWQVPAGVA